MKIIINYLMSILYHEKNKIFPYIVLFSSVSLISLITIKNNYPAIFFDYWIRLDEQFPIMILNIKLLLIVTLFLATEIFDIRRKSTAYLYFILARETNQYRFNLRINTILTAILTLLYYFFYGCILFIFESQLYNVTKFFNYMLIEYISLVTLLLITTLLKIKFSSIFVVVVTWINNYLPVKLPIGMSFLTFETLYPLPVYMVTLVVCVIIMFILEKRKWGSHYACCQ